MIAYILKGYEHKKKLWRVINAYILKGHGLKKITRGQAKLECTFRLTFLYKTLISSPVTVCPYFS